MCSKRLWAGWKQPMDILFLVGDYPYLWWILQIEFQSNFSFIDILLKWMNQLSNYSDVIWSE